MRVTTTPAAKPVSPRPLAAAKAAAPATKGKIEADLNGRIDADSALHATGKVTMDREFMERLIRHLTRKPKSFGERNVTFDPATKSYSGSVVVKVKGVSLPLTGRVVPTSDAGMPAFRFEDLSVKLGPFTLKAPFLKNLAAKLIAKEISDDVKATPGPNGIVRLDPTSLVHEIDALPAGVTIDAGTKFSTTLTADGGVEVALDSDVAAPTGANTPYSDLNVSIDPAAARRLLAPVLAPDYELRNVTFADGAISLDGQVEAKPVSDVVNVVKGLVGLIGAANGRPVTDVGYERAMLGLKLDAKLSGTQVTLTPSLSLAVKELEKTLSKAGLKPVREGNGLKFDIAPLVSRYGVKSLQAKPGSLEGRSQLDINSLIKAPILRGEA